jgi:hypothetical protein
MTDVKDAPNRPAAKPVWDQDRPPRDESRSAGTSGWLNGMIGSDRLIYFGVAVVAVVIGIVDVVTCILIGGGMWLMDIRREAQRALQVVTPPPAASPPSTQQTIWLRDGAKSIRIEPRDILWISSAGNYIEYSLADGANHLIRGTLAAAESELSRFNLARIHRTRLANLDRVSRVQSKPSGDFDLTFDTGHTVQGSRRYRSAVASLDRSEASA